MRQLSVKSIFIICNIVLVAGDMKLQLENIIVLIAVIYTHAYIYYSFQHDTVDAISRIFSYVNWNYL